MEKKLILSVETANQAEALVKFFEEVLEEAEIQMWFKDANMKYLYANDSMKVADGIAEKVVVGKTDIELYDTIRETMFTKLDQTVLETGERIKSNYVLPSGRYEQVEKIPVFNEKGEFQGILGYAKDITQQRLLQEQTKRTIEAENRFRTVFERVPVGIALYEDVTRKPVMMNDRFAQILRMSKENLSRKAWYEGFFDQDERARIAELVKEIKEGKRKSFDMEEQLIRGDDSLVWVSATITAYESPREEETLYMCVLEDISESKQMKANLERLSYTDALTGVYSRSWFLRYLTMTEEIEFPFALIMGDVNGLKVCNDVFGHFEGDRLIKSIASVFQLHTGKYDDSFTVRLGGDEFLALIRGVNANDLAQLEEDIRRDVADLSPDYIDYSVGLGSVIVTKDAFTDFESAMLAAEERMYNNKLREGRNLGDRVVENAITMLYRDPLESSHMRNVALYTEKLCEMLNLRKNDIAEIVEAARLHDIGISAATNHRELPGTPIKQDKSKNVSIIRKHAEVGYRMLHNSKNYSNLAEYVLHHHEHIDGTGYPSSIGGDDIPMASRIIAIADRYDFLINPYFRNNYSDEEAIADLREREGYELDREYTEIFIEEIIKKGKLV